MQFKMKKKKIVHIVEAFGGGIFTFLQELVNETCEEYEIVVAYAKREQTPNNFKNYFNKDVKFIEMKNLHRKINIIDDFKAFIEIKKIIKQEQPDIIHLHSSKAGFIGRMACNGKKIKVFYNPHGFSFLKQDDSKLKRRIYLILEKIAAHRKCTIVGVSKGEYNEALKLTSNAICINNGINIEEMKKILVNKKTENDIKICTIGRIGHQKNPEMFNEIAERFPNIPFTWIGDGELREKLKAKNITITGWKTREEALKLVNENDIFILPSLWEGLPMALLEAMYLKKKCLVSNVMGNRDVIENGKNGFIYSK